MTRATSWVVLALIMGSLLASWSPRVCAQEVWSSSADPRSLGMGGVRIAATNNPTAVHSNPGLLCFSGGPSIFASMPITQLATHLTQRNVLREIDVLLPRTKLLSTGVTCGVGYRRLAFGPVLVPPEPEVRPVVAEEAVSLGIGLSPASWLALGLGLRHTKLGIQDQTTFDINVGAVAQQTYMVGETKLGGQFGVVIRNIGSDWEFRGTTFQQAREIGLGLATTVERAEVRVAAGYDLVSRLDENVSQGTRNSDHHLGLELSILGVTARLGQRYEPFVEGSTHGFGIVLPLLPSLHARFDYARQASGPSANDFYGLTLAQVSEQERSWIGSRRIRARLAIGSSASSDGSAGTLFDPGVLVRGSSLVSITEALELATSMAWSWMDSKVESGSDSDWSTFFFGASLRGRLFELSPVCPFAALGVGGLRLGESYLTDGQRERMQTIAPTYSIGVGTEFQTGGRLDMDLEGTLHSVRSTAASAQPEVWWEITLGAIFNVRVE